jgi:ribokinase
VAARAGSPSGRFELATRPAGPGFALHDLLVARRLLEGGEPGRGLPARRTLLHPHTSRSRETRRAAHQPPEEEGAQPFAPLAFHESDCRLRAVICTLGDLLLDVIVRLDGPIAEDTDTYGRTRVGAGGQAANVAAWVVALGGRARFVGKRARDPAGRVVSAELADRGVDLAGPEEESGTGTVVSLAAPDGSRTMLTDRGVAAELRPEELDPAWFAGCEWLHVPGYSLVRGPIRDAALAAAQLAPRVSVDLSSTAAIAAAGVEDFRDSLATLAPRVVFANEAEAELVGPLHAETVAVKRGARGCTVQREGRSEELPAVPAEAVDSTGAGDAFAAGFLLGGPDLALDAAARCVSRMGAMP